jgi:hypothetical protein
MFGIDVRWAGLLVAGLVAVLLSAPLVLRRSSREMSLRPPISATLVEAPAEPKTAELKPAAPAAAESRQAASAPAPLAPARPAPETADQMLALQKSESPGSEAPADDEHRRFAPAPAASEARRAPAASARSRAAAEPVGGEAGTAVEDAPASRPPVHLLVTALDGEGEAPAIVEGPDSSRFTELRGREFVLTVEASGRIRSIEPSTANGFLAAPNAKARPSSGAVTSAGPLQELRFAPSDRPRRLAVRVE